MSKKGKNTEMTPKERFGQLYIAFQAETLEQRYTDIKEMVPQGNAFQSEIVQDFLFSILHRASHLGYTKLYLVYKLILTCINSTLDKQQLSEAVVNKISTLLDQHKGYEYDLEGYTSDQDDVTAVVEMEGHKALTVKDALLAQEIFQNIQTLQIIEEDPKAAAAAAKGKGPAKKYMVQLTIDEAKFIIDYLLSIIINLNLYRLVFDKTFKQEELYGQEIISPVHLPQASQLIPLSEGFLFKEKSELEMAVYKALKPKAAQMYRDLVKEQKDKSRPSSKK